MTNLNEKVFMDAKDVMEVLDISSSKAYEIIRDLNKELKAKGYMTVYGKVNTNYFVKKFLYSED